MARRRPAAPPDPAGGVPVLPRHLADNHECKGADEYREFHQQRSAWFRDHSINPGDWSKVQPVLLATWAAYDIPRGALNRARIRAQMKGDS